MLLLVSTIIAIFLRGSRREENMFRRIAGFGFIGQVLSILSFVALVGCGNSKGGSAVSGASLGSCQAEATYIGSCRYTNSSYETCENLYGDLSESELQEVIVQCENNSGTESDGVFSTDKCSAASAAGLCKFGLDEPLDGLPEFKILYFYGMSSSQAKGICDAIGSSVSSYSQSCL